MGIKILHDIDTDGEVQGTSLDINGNADISGNLSGVDTLTALNLIGTPADGNTNSLKLGRTDTSNYWYVNHAGNDFRLYNEAGSGSNILLGVDASGNGEANNVGIGTASPGRELEVQGTGNVFIKVAASTDDDSSAIELENTQNTWTIKNDDTADDALKFQSSGGTKATILKTGNVGIGTTSPSRLLDVDGIQGWSSSDTEVTALNPTSTGTDFSFKNSSGVNVVRFDGRPNGDAFFNTGGDFGISTGNPAHKLDVNGSARIGSSSQTTTSLYLTATNTDGAPAMAVQTIMQGYEGRGQGTFHTDTSKSGEEWFSGINYNASFDRWSVGYDLTGGQAEYLANALFTVFHNGNVGIGTTDPSEKLHVVGDALITTDLHLTGSASKLLIDSTETVQVASGVVTIGQSNRALNLAASAVTSGTLNMSGNINLNSGADIILEADNAGGGAASSIQYLDAAGTNRIMLAADSDVVVLSNRAANGTVQIRANTATAGGGSNEITVVTVEDTKVDIAKDLNVAGVITGKQKQAYNNSFTDDLVTTKHYIPFQSQFEQTSIYQEEVATLMPSDGRIVSVTVRVASVTGSGNMTIGVHTCAPGVSSFTTGNWTEEETEVLAVASTDDYHVFHFAFSNAKHFDSGDLLTVSIQNSADLSSNTYWYVTTVVEYDWNTFLGGTSGEFDSNP